MSMSQKRGRKAIYTPEEAKERIKQRRRKLNIENRDYILLHNKMKKYESYLNKHASGAYKRNPRYSVEELNELLQQILEEMENLKDLKYNE